MQSKKLLARKRRHHRIRKLVNGTEQKPRLVVFRSNSNLYTQIINDETGTTLVSQSTMKEKGNSVEEAKKLGEKLGKEAVKKGIKEIVFDRNGYKYHGKIKALADAAREAGLQF